MLIFSLAFTRVGLLVSYVSNHDVSEEGKKKNNKHSCREIDRYERRPSWILWMELFVDFHAFVKIDNYFA